MFYKETEFQDTLMGKIPSDWKIAKPEECIDKIISGDWGSDTPKEDFIECRVVRGTDIPKVEKGNFEEVPIRYIESSKFRKAQIKPNDLLVEISGGSKDQPTGRILLLTKQVLEKCDKNFFLTNFVKLIKLNSNVKPLFFYYWWHYQYIHGKTTLFEIRTTNIRNFKYKQFLSNEYIFLPSSLEQQKIAEFLSILDSAIGLIDRVIWKTERLKKGLMQTLLTKGIGHTEFKETRIGRIPKEWDIAKLGEIATIRYGLGQPPESDENGTPMIRATNIKRGVIVETDVLRVKRSTIPESRNPFLREGDVIVVRSGAYTGDIGHITKRWEGAIAGYDLVVSPSNRINSVYLAHYLLSLRVQTYFSQLKSRSAQPHLNSEQVSDTPIALPSLSEQRNIADFLSTIDKKLGLERNEKVRLERVKRGLMDLLLTGKVRVKVN